MYFASDMKTSVDTPVETRKPRRRVSWLKWGFRLGILGMLAAGAGFVFFFNLIETGQTAGPDKADAIVVLTGGPSRIPEAVKLLMNGKGERLLISGVNTSTTRDELAALSPGEPMLFECCVDLDHRARDTIGNANETGAWVAEHGFGSLIVVTDSYHMPRSIAELRRTLPDTELIPFPVQHESVHLDALWEYPGTLKLLAREYVKFVPALMRCIVIQIGLNRGLYGGSMNCLNAPARL